MRLNPFKVLLTFTVLGDDEKTPLTTTVSGGLMLEDPIASIHRIIEVLKLQHPGVVDNICSKLLQLAEAALKDDEMEKMMEEAQRLMIGKLEVSVDVEGGDEFELAPEDYTLEVVWDLASYLEFEEVDPTQANAFMHWLAGTTLHLTIDLLLAQDIEAVCAAMQTTTPEETAQEFFDALGDELAQTIQPHVDMESLGKELLTDTDYIEVGGTYYIHTN